MQLGKLEKVPLREVWKHEALNFTTWLAQDENLKLLSNEIGIDISLIQTEASVGKFSVDILAEEENTNRKIVIENQLESTVRNISVTQVNIKAAESQIRDVDFAAESANFSKLNLIAQAGAYAMSQANALQQNVLRLLQ